MSMARLIVVVEGQTEEKFVNSILAPHLFGIGYQSVDARIMGNPRQPGGIKPWISVKRDLKGYLRDRAGFVVTTMVDYYGLPQTGGKAWPGRTGAAGLYGAAQKAEAVEKALAQDILAEMGGSFNSARFLPFVTMHEFEGLLFSDCASFAGAIGHADLAAGFQAIRNGFDSPEEINDSYDTAPSRRVEKLFPGYQKPLQGTLAAKNIGLSSIRLQCPHFNGWVCRLEKVISP